MFCREIETSGPVFCLGCPALCLQTKWSAALGYPGRKKQNKHSKQQQTNIVISILSMSLLLSVPATYIYLLHIYYLTSRPPTIRGRISEGGFTSSSARGQLPEISMQLTRHELNIRTIVRGTTSLIVFTGSTDLIFHCKLRFHIKIFLFH